jgi:hypothetical protein
MAGLSMRQLPVEPSGGRFCREYVTVNDIRRCNAIAVNHGVGRAPGTHRLRLSMNRKAWATITNFQPERMTRFFGAIGYATLVFAAAWLFSRHIAQNVTSELKPLSSVLAVIF